MDQLINKAKEVDIATLYKGELKPSGKWLIGLCPLHNDSKPSFAIKRETNSFYCFTEGVGGDVISFYQKLHNVDFKTAVKELTK